MTTPRPRRVSAWALAVGLASFVALPSAHADDCNTYPDCVCQFNAPAVAARAAVQTVAGNSIVVRIDQIEPAAAAVDFAVGDVLTVDGGVSDEVLLISDDGTAARLEVAEPINQGEINCPDTLAPIPVDDAMEIVLADNCQEQARQRGFFPELIECGSDTCTVAGPGRANETAWPFWSALLLASIILVSRRSAAR